MLKTIDNFKSSAYDNLYNLAKHSNTKHNQNKNINQINYIYCLLNRSIINTIYRLNTIKRKHDQSNAIRSIKYKSLLTDTILFI